MISVQLYILKVYVFNLSEIQKAQFDELLSFDIQAEEGRLTTDGWQPPIGISTRVCLGRREGAAYSAPAGLFSIIIAFLQSRGIPHQAHDMRERPQLGCPDVGPPSLFSYQQDAADHAVRMGSGVIVMPPRAGKTRVGIEMVRQISLPTAWLAPTTNIVTQTVRAFDAVFGKNYAVALKGSKWQELTHVNCIVMTAATATNLPPEFWKTRQSLFVDEFHHAASKQYHALWAHTGHIYFRFGLTGTFFRSTQMLNGRPVSDEMLMQALISQVIYRVTPKMMLDAKRLTPLKTAIMPMECPPMKFVSTASRAHEREGIWQHEHRNSLVAWCAAIMHSRGLRVLVIVDTKTQADAIHELLKTFVKPHPEKRDFEIIETVSTNRPPQVCQAVIDSFAHGGAVEILIGTTMIGEGTDIPECDAMVYARGKSAEVSHTQALYPLSSTWPTRITMFYDATRRSEKRRTEARK
jgi:superfamily II DNA or RNA helicase